MERFIADLAIAVGIVAAVEILIHFLVISRAFFSFPQGD